MLPTQTRVLLQVFLIVLFVACLMLSLWFGWDWAAGLFTLAFLGACADLDYRKSE